MKRIINVVGILLIFFIILSVFNHAYAATVTLEQIVKKFNNSSIVESYESAGGSISATNDEDSINVTVNVEGKTNNVEFLVEGNILSIEIDMEEELAFSKAYVALSIFDIIGQLHGYEEGELAQTLNADESKNYKIENEGFEGENISETKVKLKIDITKKIPLVDFSNTYIEVDDINEMYKEFISGDGFCSSSKGNVLFEKSGYDGENTILVAEKTKLTENTYKSVITILEVMFNDDKVIEYFKKNYPSLSSGDKEFIGFSIKVNPTDKSEEEENLVDNNYEFVRIEINKEKVINQVNNLEETKNETKDEIVKDTQQETNNQIANLDKLPDTGDTKSIVLSALYTMIGVCCACLVTILFVAMIKKK